jgi:uncharacterized protein (DUF4415 family)
MNENMLLNKILGFTENTSEQISEASNQINSEQNKQDHKINSEQKLTVKNKGGRPKKIDTRKHVINVRFDELELATLELTAKAYDVSKSELIRSAVLGSKLPAPIPQINQEQWLLLGNIANNLNQVLKALNEEKKFRDKASIEKLQKVIDATGKTVKTVQSLRTEILGRS